MAGPFKTYDIRGRLGTELSEDLAYRVGRGFVELLQPGQVAVGHDMRLSSPDLAAALIRGLTDAGADVHDLGLCGTEEVYFAAFHYQLGGGIMVTASHNPAEYNGMKLVGAGAAPLTDASLRALESRVEQPFASPARPGTCRALDHRGAYLNLLERLVARPGLQGLRLLGNAGNGAVGPLMERVAERFGLDLRLIQAEPDGTFPHGVPNPLLPENRGITSRAVVEHSADLGLAWDGDFDRCFAFDGSGRFIESYYLISLLAAVFLQSEPGATILYDPRLTWCTQEQVAHLGGRTQVCRTGHVFFKAALRETGAIYGAEMSGHHYFRDFGCCDSGVLPALLLARVLVDRGQSLGSLVAHLEESFPVSGEINRSVLDSRAALARVRERYAPGALVIDDLDGLSMEFAHWRFNLRCSNTEPLLRLNVESRGRAELVAQQTRSILELVESA